MNDEQKQPNNLEDNQPTDNDDTGALASLEAIEETIDETIDEIIGESGDGVEDTADDATADDVADDAMVDDVVDDAMVDDVVDDAMVDDVVDDAMVDDVVDGAFHEPTISPMDDNDAVTMDIDAALAAVADLTTLASDDDVVDDNAEVYADNDDAYADDDTKDEVETSATDTESAPAPLLARPPVSTLKRGQMASVVPAFLLIGGGLALMALIVSDGDVPLSTLGLVLLGAVGVMFLAHWLSSRRWAQGSLWAGAMLLTSAVALFIAPQIGTLALAYLLPLAWAVAFLLTGFLGHSHDARLIFVALFFALIGGAGWLVWGGVLAPALVTTLASLAPIAIIIALVLVIVPARRS
jgi:hypothetical protein